MTQALCLVQVTSQGWGRQLQPDPAHLVTQVFCSACPVAYNSGHAAPWQPLASIVLEGAFEATLRAAALNAHRHRGAEGSRRVFLTLLGGGVFGNSVPWIVAALDAALQRCAGLGLDVRLVLFEPPVPREVSALVDKWGQ